jgi:hypothetical protein
MATTGRKLEDADSGSFLKHSEASGTYLNNDPCTKSGNELEKYLEDIYSRYCRISIIEKEVEFIRKGVEKLTLEYLQKTYRSTPCEDKSCKIRKCCELELVKVGSFYEGTRNGFPNEFDFIAVLGTVDEEPDENAHNHLLKQAFCTHCEVYKSGEFPDYSMQFHFTYGSQAHGKATLLQFVYKRGKEEDVIIDVDVVIALRCYKTEKFYMVTDIFNKDFYEEILKTGSFLFIYTRASSVEKTTEGAEKQTGPWEKTITESETRFVSDILSKTHKKVYRILKYIINGPFGEYLFKYLDDVQDFQSSWSALSGTGFSISSYVIKIAVIHHHYDCKIVENKFGDCVLQILFYIRAAYNQNNSPFIAMHSLLCRTEVGPVIGRGNYRFLGTFYWCLQAFTQRLASLKSSNDKLIKCNHDLENSFLEMALRLDMFTEYETFLMNLESKFSDPRILWPERPNLKTVVKKVKEYNEKRNKVSNCPWCDYPIFKMAHERKL